MPIPVTDRSGQHAPVLDRVVELLFRTITPPMGDVPSKTTDRTVKAWASLLEEDPETVRLYFSANIVQRNERQYLVRSAGYVNGRTDGGENLIGLCDEPDIEWSVEGIEVPGDARFRGRYQILHVTRSE